MFTKLRYLLATSNGGGPLAANLLRKFILIVFAQLDSNICIRKTICSYEGCLAVVVDNSCVKVRITFRRGQNAVHPGVDAVRDLIIIPDFGDVK